MEFLANIFGKSSIFGKPQKNVAANAFPWVEELNTMNGVSAIEFATQRLKSELDNQRFDNDKFLDAFLSVEAKTHNIVDKLAEQFVNADHANADIEEHLSNVAYIYHRQVFLIYIKFLDLLTPSKPNSLPLMLARATYNATQMIKWRFFNFQSAPASVWLQLSKLYLIAEKFAITETSVQPYPNKSATTLSSLYVQACMLGNLQSSSLKHQQIELVIQALEKWTKKVSIEKEYDSNSQVFYIDTSRDAPAKITRNINPTPSFRYWHLDSVNTEVATALSLIERGVMNISKQHPTYDLISHKYAFETFKLLRAEWSTSTVKRQRRRGERVKTTKPAHATYGFSETCTHIKHNVSSRMVGDDKKLAEEASHENTLPSQNIANEVIEINFHHVDLTGDSLYMSSAADTCNIVDESSHGLGLQTNKPIKEISMGMLIGITVEDKKNDVNIGVVRCIKPILGNEFHLGIEVLSKAAFYIELFDLSKTTNSTTDSSVEETAIEALLLPQKVSVNKVDTLIIPRRDFNKSHTYRTNLHNSSIVIKPVEILESHEHWVQISYAVIN